MTFRPDITHNNIYITHYTHSIFILFQFHNTTSSNTENGKQL